jgi:histidinol phosphatase-like PHP family hydrolase
MDQPQRIDLHTHSIFSDGSLLPSELLRRAAVLGHAAVAITDHADASNMEAVIAGLRRVLERQSQDFGLQLIVGVELTHVAPHSIAPLARRAKELGADIVVVHGETIVEPVAPGTNLAAITSLAVDLLAHPGFLTLEEARLAAQRTCLIEVTARIGHSLTNGHVARVCREAGAPMVLDTDTHDASDLITLDMARRVAAGAGMTEEEVLAATIVNPHALLERVLSARRSDGWA